jgi:hypothetical protein
MQSRPIDVMHISTRRLLIAPLESFSHTNHALTRGWQRVCAAGQVPWPVVRSIADPPVPGQPPGVCWRQGLPFGMGTLQHRHPGLLSAFEGAIVILM